MLYPWFIYMGKNEMGGQQQAAGKFQEQEVPIG